MENGIEFKVNEYLTLKLEKGELNQLETIIYIQGKRFIQCKFLLLNIPVDELQSIEEVESVDELAEGLDHSNDVFSPTYIEIPPEVEFWAHASNLQVWVEHDYNTNLIHSNLAFPLLKKLSEAGDIIAKRVFKEEIVKRFLTGVPSVQEFLVEEGFMDYLTKDEMSIFVNSGLDAIIKLEKILEKKVKLVIKKTRPSIANPAFIVENGEIASLRIVRNKLNNIPEPIRELTSLKKLYLNHNLIETVPEWIGELKFLKRLDLSNNKITNIPETLGNLKCLKHLNLFNNNIMKLNDSIGSLASLKSLNLSKNQLSSLPESIGNLISLKELYVNRNELTKVSKSIKNLNLLENLELGRNKIKSVPDSFGNLKSLINLSLSHNPLSKIPKTILKIRSLNSLDLNKTRLRNINEIKNSLKKIKN
jgi:uncharacterized protein YlbG (UPF0298 family)